MNETLFIIGTAEFYPVLLFYDLIFVMCCTVCDCIPCMCLETDVVDLRSLDAIH